MGRPRYPPFTFTVSFVGVLLEKHSSFFALADLMNPVEPNRPTFSKKRIFPCGKIDSTSIQVPLPTLLILIRLHQFSLKGCISGTYLGYATLLSKEEYIPPSSNDFGIFTPLSMDNSLLNPRLLLSEESSTGPVFWKERSGVQLILIQRIFFTLLSKSAHKGVTFVDIELFMTLSVFGFVTRLNSVIKTILSHLIHTQLVATAFPRCAWQRFFIAQYGWSQSQFTPRPTLNGPPCIHCPSLAECTPQGGITPFDCTYIKSWEEQQQQEH